MNEEKLIDIRKLIASKNPKLLKVLPNFILRYLENILHQDEINDFVIRHADKKNELFAQAVIDDFNIDVQIEGLENIPKEGGITIVMNHPLGGMDAMAFISALRHHRTDLKFIVNDLLLYLEGMQGMFVGVNKHGKNDLKNLHKIDDLFSSSEAICVFPAGLVSRKIDGEIIDLEWKKTFVTQSKKYDRLVVPVHIEGKLTPFFYNLSKFRRTLGIKANIEMLYLADQLYKQKNRTIRIKVGKPVDLKSEIVQGNDKKIAQQIKNQVYDL